MLVIFWAAWFTLTVLDDDDDGGVMTGAWGHAMHAAA
jgi:hypothetical protein